MERKKTLLWLWGMLLGGCLLIFHSYLLGNDAMVYSGVGSDTKEQYVMLYNSVANHLRNGDFSLWDFNNGFGTNMFNTTLMNPFLWLIYGVGAVLGPEHIAGALVYLQILQILLSGTTCYFFLSQYRFQERNKLLASFMYAFNGYLMVWGQHYQLGSVLVFLPLLFLFVEKTLKNRRHAFGTALMSAVLIINGFYQGYMCMLGVGIYVCIRVLLYEDAPWKKKWKDFWATAGAMGFGVFMGAVNLFPSLAAQIGATSRLSSDSSLWQKVVENFIPYAREYYKTLIYRMFGSNMQNSDIYFSGYQNYYEAISLFFSTLFIFLLAQYLFTIHKQEKKKLQKAAQYLGVLVGVFLVTIQTGSLMFNGFAYSFSRHTFLFMPLFALLSAYELEQILEKKRLNIPALILSAAAVALVYAKAYRYMDSINDKNNAFLLCMTGLVMGAALFALARWKKADRRLCWQILALALFVNVVSDTTICYRYRDNLKKNDVSYFQGTYHSSVQDALAWLKEQDPSFYRVEKDFHTASGCLDSLAQDYMGVSTYNSTQNEHIRRFVRKLWPQLLTGYDYSHYKFSNGVRERTLASLTGVKYVLSRQEGLEAAGYELLHQTGDIYIYRNPDTETIARFFKKTVTEEEYETAKKKDAWTLLKDVLVTGQETPYQIAPKELEEYERNQVDLLDKERIDTSVCQITKDGLTAQDQHFLTLPLKERELAKYESARVELTIETDMGTELEIRFGDDRAHVAYHYPGDHRYVFAIPKGTEEIQIQVTNGGVNTRISKLKFFGVKEETEFSKGAEIALQAPRRDTRITGKIQAAEDGMVMIAVPYENGWTVRLNGQEQETLVGDYGFTAFEVKAGDYELEMTFEAPLFRASLMISLVSWTLFVVLWIYIGGTQRKHRKKEGRDQ